MGCRRGGPSGQDPPGPLPLPPFSGHPDLFWVLWVCSASRQPPAPVAWLPSVSPLSKDESGFAAPPLVSQGVAVVAVGYDIAPKGRCCPVEVAAASTGSAPS